MTNTARSSFRLGSTTRPDTKPVLPCAPSECGFVIGGAQGLEPAAGPAETRKGGQI